MITITHITVDHKVIHILAELTKREADEILPRHILADDLAIDSIQFLEFLSLLEEEFHFEIEVDDLDPVSFRTVESCINFVKKRVQL